MIKKFKLFAVLALIVTLSFNLPTKSLAAPVITDSSINILAETIEKELAWFKTIGKLTGYELNIDEDIEITNDDKFYSLLIPNVTIYIRDIDKHLHIGNISANLLQPNKDIWRARIAIPNTIILTNQFGDIETTINFSGNTLSLIWVPEKNMYPEIRAFFENIQITSEDGNNITLTIKDASYKSGLNPNQTKDWAGINKMKSWGGGAILEINDLKSVINKNISLKINRLVNRTEYKQIHPVGINNNRDSVFRFMRIIENKDTEINALDTYNTFASLRASHQGTKNNLEIQGLDFMHLQEKTNIKSDSIILNRLQISSEITGIEEGLFNLINRIEFNDLKTTEGLTGDFQSIMPKHGVIPLSLRNIPLRLLKKIFIDELIATTKTNTENILNRIITKIKPFLRDNNSYAYINEMHVKDGGAYMRINASARVNPHAVYGFSGKLGMLFAGYNFLDTNLNTLAVEPHVDLGTLIAAFKPNTQAEKARPESFVSIGNYSIDILESGRIKIRRQRHIENIVIEESEFANIPQKKPFTFNPFRLRQKQ